MIALLGLALAQQPAAPPMIWTGCTWTDAPFQKWAKLRPVGARHPVAEIRGLGTQPVTVTGALGQDLSGYTTFSGVWSSEGLSVAAYADPRESSLFRLSGTGTIDLGPGAKLIVGGDLEPFGWEDGEPVVRARRGQRSELKKGGGFARLSCERLSVTRHALDFDDSALVSEVFGDARPIRLEADTKLKLRDRPGGRVVLRFEKADYRRLVYEVGASEGWTHVALPRWPGLVWHGWAEDLRIDESEDSSEVSGLLGALGGTAEPIPTVSCATSRVLYAVGASPRPVPLGMVAPNTELVVNEPVVGGLDVRPLEYWLFPLEGWRLVIFETETCTRGTYAKPAADLDSVFDELGEP